MNNEELRAWVVDCVTADVEPTVVSAGKYYSLDLKAGVIWTDPSQTLMYYIDIRDLFPSTVLSVETAHVNWLAVGKDSTYAYVNVPLTKNRVKVVEAGIVVDNTVWIFCKNKGMKLRLVSSKHKYHEMVTFCGYTETISFGKALQAVEITRRTAKPVSVGHYAFTYTGSYIVVTSIANPIKDIRDINLSLSD